MLDGVRVLDLAVAASADPLAGAAGAHGARILADLGADVIKVEPPEGDVGRGQPPFLGGIAGPDRSLFWIALNANKRSVVLDPSPAGERRLRALVERADVVVQSEARLGHDLVAAWNDQCVLVTCTPYGADGPLAAVAASDLEVTAASGSLALAGEPGRPPVRSTLPQAPFWTGMYAAMGALTALLARPALGRGQHIDVSGQASLVTVHPPAPIFWDVLRQEHRRLGPRLLGRSIVGTSFLNIWPCRDGHVSFALQGGPTGRHTGRMLAAWMRERGFAAKRIAAIDWDAWDNRTLTQDEVDELEAEVGAFFGGITKREFFTEVVARDMLGYPASDAADVYANEQLRARSFWQDVAVADGRTLPFPGGFALFDGTRPSIRRPAPRVGEHDDEVFAGTGAAR